MAFHTLKVARVDRLTEDSAAITLEVPPELAGRFRHLAGQSLAFRREGQRRTYSICSAVGEAPRIAVRTIPDGLFSRWLTEEVRPGDEIEVAPPTGSFRAEATAGRHVCIAAGSGITPVLSIASTVLADPGSDVTLIYGNRNAGSVMFAEELSDLKDRYPTRFELIHVLSREPRDVELFTGRLDAARLRALLTSLVPLDEVDNVWLCGPLGLIESARAVLAELGVPAEKVHFELFFVDEPPPVYRHADRVVEGETSDVTVILDGRSTTTPMPHDRTVLDSAQQARPDLPFACKGGVCGTCRARVCAGEVDMVRNYALEEAEVAAGFVLTCQSFPVSDEVTVDYDR